MTSFRILIARLFALVSVAFLGFTQLAYAAPTDPFAPGGTGRCDITNLGTFLNCGISFIDSIVVPIVFALAFVVFIVGIYRYFILGGSNEEKRKEGQQLLLWGLIGFVIMLSVWGLINVINGTLGLSSAVRPQYPVFNQSNAPAAQTQTTLPSSGATQTPAPSNSGTTIINSNPTPP